MNGMAGIQLRAGLFLVLLAGLVPAHGQSASPVAGGAQAPANSDANASVSASKAHDATYVIGPGDVLAINVWKEEALSKTMPVLPDGNISLSLVGEVQASGKTPLQLESELSEKLKSFITSPQVTVMVQEVKSKTFNVMGMVNKPGSYSITVAPTIMDAIAAAGGFKDFAKETKMYILREAPGGGQTRIEFNYKDFIKGKNLDKNKNVQLAAHDTVVVP